MDIPLALMTALLASLPNWGGFILLYASNTRTIRKLFSSLDNLQNAQQVALDKRLIAAEAKLEMMTDLFRLLLVEYRAHPALSPVPAAAPVAPVPSVKPDAQTLVMKPDVGVVGA